jgi:hypothetical protein
MSSGTNRCYASGVKLFAVTDSAEKRGSLVLLAAIFSTALHDTASTNKIITNDTFGNDTK